MSPARRYTPYSKAHACNFCELIIIKLCTLTCWSELEGISPVEFQSPESNVNAKGDMEFTSSENMSRIVTGYHFYSTVTYNICILISISSHNIHNSICTIVNTGPDDFVLLQSENELTQCDGHDDVMW